EPHDAFGPRGKMRGASGERIDRLIVGIVGLSRATHERRQRERSQAAAGASEEVAPRTRHVNGAGNSWATGERHAIRFKETNRRKQWEQRRQPNRRKQRKQR